MKVILSRPDATFDRHDGRLVLTGHGASRSIWDLPTWFEPRDGRPALGYHQDPRRWTHSGGRDPVRSVARGQELVLDTTEYPESISWLRTILRG
jgi:hypothetical protein